MNNFISYLLIGVIFNFLLDLLGNYLETENKFNIKEKIIMSLIWPVMIIIFIYHFVKTIGSGKY